MLKVQDHASKQSFVVKGPELQTAYGKPSKWFSYKGKSKRATSGEVDAFCEEVREIAQEKRAWTDHNNTPLFGSPDEPGTFCYKFIEYEKGRTLPSIGDLSMVEVKEKACALRQIGEFDHEGVKLRDVKIGDVRRSVIVADIVHDIAGLGAESTAKRKWTYFKQLFDYAVECDQIKVNPCDFKKRKNPFKGKRRVRTETLSDDLDTIVRKVIEHAPKRYQLAMNFAAHTGLRAGEQIALTWDDINFDQGKVLVRSAWKKTKELGDPKSYHGTREVDLPAKLALLLKEWKIKQSPRLREKHNLVFPNQYGRHFTTNKTWREEALHKACEDAGVERIRWHDLRHFYASILIFTVKAPPQEVSLLMGHHDFAFTLRQYGHWFRKAREKSEVGDKISALMGEM